MKITLPLLFFTFVTISSFSQEKRKSTIGEILKDSTLVPIENVHIINKNSQKGTVSNQFGNFSIPVKENDTLIFSDIQYQYKEIVITKKHLKKLQLTILLKPKINELDEVIVKEHDLSGNLAFDAKNAKEIGPINPELLKPDAWDVDFRIVDNYDEIDRLRPPNASKLTNPNIPIGGNVLGLLAYILNPIMNEVSKIGQRKRRIKKIEKNYIEKSKNAPDNIRQKLGDTFFIETLKIPSEDIEPFINHCKSKGIIDLYLTNKRVELIDIFIRESNIYLKKNDIKK